jgi:hypothetical protein
MNKNHTSLADAPPDDSKKTPADPFKFDPQVKREAWTRQNGHCGICGESLVAVMQGKTYDANNDRVEAHHVVSRQSAKLTDLPEVVAFLRTADNCMYLCGDCHLRRAHGHNFGEGGLRPPAEFQYSHGGAQGPMRNAWISRAQAQWLAVYKPQESGKA